MVHYVRVDSRPLGSLVDILGRIGGHFGGQIGTLRQGGQPFAGIIGGHIGTNRWTVRWTDWYTTSGWTAVRWAHWWTGWDELVDTSVDRLVHYVRVDSRLLGSLVDILGRIGGHFGGQIGTLRQGGQPSAGLIGGQIGRIWWTVWWTDWYTTSGWTAVRWAHWWTVRDRFTEGFLDRLKSRMLIRSVSDLLVLSHIWVTMYWRVAPVSGSCISCYRNWICSKLSEVQISSYKSSIPCLDVSNFYSLRLFVG